MDPGSKQDEAAVKEEVIAADDDLDPQPLEKDEQQGDLLDTQDDDNDDEEQDEIEDMNDVGEVDEDGNFKERGAPGDNEDDDYSTPFQDEGGFDDKEDVELFDDEDDDEDVEEDDVPLTGAVDGTRKKKRRIFTKYKKKTTTEREPSKAEKRRRRRACCLLICCCLLILLIILLLIFLVFKEDDDPVNDGVPDDDGDDGFVDDFFGFGDGLVPDSVQTTPFDPYVKDDCDFSDNFQPHVLAQCICYGKVSIIADDIRELYTLLKTRLMPELYTEEGTMWDEPITSCDPRNQALLWLSSGDTRRSGDLVQRFLTSTAYIAMNGTKWDYQNLWLSDQNECLWIGLKCNKRFQIHSLALDTINIFGTVRICFVGWFVFVFCDM